MPGSLRVDPPGYKSDNSYQSKDVFENVTKNLEINGGKSGPIKYGVDE